MWCPRLKDELDRGQFSYQKGVRWIHHSQWNAELWVCLKIENMSLSCFHTDFYPVSFLFYDMHCLNRNFTQESVLKYPVLWSKVCFQMDWTLLMKSLIFLKMSVSLESNSSLIWCTSLFENVQNIYLKYFYRKKYCDLKRIIGHRPIWLNNWFPDDPHQKCQAD